MKKCKDIKDSLPLYMDDSLSDADKQTVEEHLKSCPRCSKALGELSKTKSLVNNLAEVEPPPWFKQRIISRIREEAEKKSLLQKWFYPVRIKIPVQIMATIVIAVLAVYIYRSGNEQINTVLPPSATAPVVEAQKGQIPEQKIKKPIGKTIREEYSLQEKAASRKPVSQTAVDKVIDINEQVVSGIKDDRYESAPAAKVIALPEAQLEKKKENQVLGGAMKESMYLKAQSSMPKTVFHLRVDDISTAMEETEQLLIKYDAKNIIRQIIQGKATLSAKIKNQKIKDLTASLKTIGQIEEYIMPEADAEGNISMVIEIINN